MPRLLVSRMILGFLLVTLTQLLLTGWELTRLRAVHNGVLASADHARNSAVAQEMEINLIEVGLATQAFLLTHDPRMIAKLDGDAEDFRRAFAAYRAPLDSAAASAHQRLGREHKLYVRDAKALLQVDRRLRQQSVLLREARAQVLTQLPGASAGEQAAALRVITAVGDTLLRLPGVPPAPSSAPAESGVEKFPSLQSAMRELSADNQAIIDTLQARGALLASIDMRQLQFDDLIDEALQLPAEQALLEAERYSDITVMQTQVVIISTAVLLMVMMITGLWTIWRSLAPLGRLAHAARTIATGNLYTDIVITRDDEIGELATAMKAMALQLQSSTVSRDFFELMIDSMRDAVLAFGKDGELLNSNAGARHILGLLEPQAAHAHTAFNLLAAALQGRDGAALPLSLPWHQDWRGEARMTLANGNTRPLWVTLRVLREGGGEEARAVLALTDQSQLQEAAHALQRMALEDPLTGLPNRSWLEAQLNEWTRTPAERGAALALLVIRLDRFLQLDEQLPGIGDQVMRTMAMRLREAIHAPAQLVCLGRGQFAVMISTIQTPETAAECARLIARILRPPVGGSETLTYTAGIGIALMPEDASTAESVVAAAESAASYACADGGDRIEFYRHEMTRKIAQEHALERDLRMALTRGELAVAYQPKYSVQGTAVTGFEALVRWHHPLAGAIAPDQFIQLAERTGLIVPLGIWMLHSVCRQIQAWHSADLMTVRVAVNVSALQLQQGNFVEAVRDALRDYSIRPEWLELEITESAALSERFTETLRKIRDTGVTLTLDDFGTGYSSLSVLRHLPIQGLKIDRSFVKGIPHNRDDCALTSMIVKIGNELGLKVTAEGVETQAQLDFLRRLGCDEMQGYLLGRPLSPEAAGMLVPACMQVSVAG